MSKPRVRVEPVAGGKGVVERLIGQTALGGGGFPEKVAPCGQGRILGLSDDKARGEGHAPQRASNRAGFKGLSCLRPHLLHVDTEEGSGLCLRSVPPPPGPLPHRRSITSPSRGIPSRAKELARAIPVAVRV
jgi:hypothetical protein